MRALMLVVACGAMAVFTSGAYADCTRFPSLDMKVQRDADRKYFLTFKWTNLGPDRVRVHVRDWAIRNAFMLWAVRGDLGHVTIRQFVTIDDPPPAPPDVEDYVELGESVEGKLPLDRKFPDLSKTLEETDVVFFWQFHFGDPRQILEGCLVVPRLRPGSR